MRYRRLGRTDENVSILGFGAMRLPVLGGEHHNMDVPQATEMLHFALEHGVNYVDTAYPYHGRSHSEPGASETFLGDALQGGYREKVLLATKLPSWLVERSEDMDRFLEGQLKRLKTEVVDCYLLHSLNEGTWERLRRLNVLEFLDRAKQDGRIRYAGFSFHGGPDLFPRIVDAYGWDFCQIQYNYMDVDYQAGAAGLRYAGDKGLGVVIMEPLKGGRLAARIPPEVERIWEQAPFRRSPVEWALRFVWNDPRVSLLLSGMSSPAQVRQNVLLAEGGEPDSLSAEELELIARVRAVYRSRTRADCTQCKYCLPCPSGVDIPRVLEHLNDAALFRSLEETRLSYSQGRTGLASECSQCAECEESCPQGLPIRDLMTEAVELLERRGRSHRGSSCA
ncbi:MAG: aldo/keto reductase [Thermoleophilia bacterium]